MSPLESTAPRKLERERRPFKIARGLGHDCEAAHAAPTTWRPPDLSIYAFGRLRPQTEGAKP